MPEVLAPPAKARVVLRREPRRVEGRLETLVFRLGMAAAALWVPDDASSTASPAPRSATTSQAASCP
jgi:hypothetical protein